MTHMRGSRLRSEVPPADLARGMERDRARFMSSVIINPSTWKIAQTLHRTMRGNDGEGLRGIYRPHEGEHGTLYWWPAHIMAHGQGMRLLGVTDRAAGEVLEVEANVDANGTIYLAWNGRMRTETTPDHSPRFLSHPSIGDLVDGCLARRGRQIVLNEDGIRLMAKPATATSLDVARQAERQAGWSAIADRIAAWTLCRKPVDRDGGTVPAPAALRPLRLYVAETVERWHAPPVPEMTVGQDRAVTLRWRGGGSGVTLTFAEGEIRVRLNDQGAVREFAPVVARTPRQVRSGMPCMLSLDRFANHRPHTVTVGENGVRVSTVPEGEQRGQTLAQAELPIRGIDA